MKKELFSLIISHFDRAKVILLSFVLCLLSLVFSPLSLYAQIPSYVPTSGLVGWWPFNGNANDESGNGNNGTVNGATLTADRFGVGNKSYSFNGTNSCFIEIASSNTMNSANSSFTWSFWIKMNTVSANGNNLNPGIISKTQSGTTCNGATVFETGGTPGAQTLFCNPNVNNYGAGSSVQISDNSWIHVVYSAVAGGIGLFYINGVAQPSVSVNSIFTIYNNSTLRIGRPTDNYWKAYLGLFDDLGIWNRALTQQEITNLYTSSVPPSITTTASPSLINCGETSTLTASSTSVFQQCNKADLPSTLQNGLVGYWPFCGNANDASGNGNNGTVNGATLTTDRFGNMGSAYSFDGNDFISIANSSTTNLNGSVSISFYGKLTNQTYGLFLHLRNNSNSHETSIRANAPLSFDVNNGISGANIYIPTNNLIDTSWHQFISVFNTTTNLTSFYMDGVLQGTSNIPITILGNTTISIGSALYSGSPNQFLTGKVDEVSIYNRALTPTEIQQLYNLGNVTYSWSTGATTPSITVTPAQTTSYTCTATNASGSTTSSVSVTVADTLTWTGTLDTDWHKPCNWSPQFVPKCCNNVSVPLTSNQPIVSGVAAAEDLSIFTTNGAQVTINNGANLQIADCPTAITTTACPSLAVISTTAVSSITQTTAVSGGTISYQGASAITARGVCWSTSPNPTIANSITSNGTGIGTFTSNLTGLVAGTTYYLRAYATNGSGTSYGNEVSFVSQNIQIGEFYQGGIVAYVFQPGEQGFVFGEQHGIIASSSDLSAAPWGCYTLLINGADGVGIGDGLQNSIDIVNQCTQSGIAAKLCLDLTLNNYSDWFLPSVAELYYLHQNLFISGTGNFVAGSNYWSSSETNSDFAVVFFFGNGGIVSNRYKHNNYPANVRAIRYF